MLRMPVFLLPTGTRAGLNCQIQNKYQLSVYFKIGNKNISMWLLNRQIAWMKKQMGEIFPLLQCQHPLGRFSKLYLLCLFETLYDNVCCPRPYCLFLSLFGMAAHQQEYVGGDLGAHCFVSFSGQIEGWISVWERWRWEYSGGRWRRRS